MWGVMGGLGLVGGVEGEEVGVCVVECLFGWVVLGMMWWKW